MCTQIKTINQCYKALEYKINKQEALKKISTLSHELKFKDNWNMSDRFLQTASVIEKNLTVFKSACNHVDMITMILNYLYNVSMKLIHDDKFEIVRHVTIIHMMFVICEEPEIPLFLKAALLTNSTVESTNVRHDKLMSDHIFEMIVFEDADLYAVFNSLKITSFFLLEINQFFVHEPIKEKFLWFMGKYFKLSYTDLDSRIVIFRTRIELLEFLGLKSPCLHMVSLWSENIGFAKILATKLYRDVTFINSLLEPCYGISFFSKWLISSFNILSLISEYKFTESNKTNPNKYTDLIYHLYYDGNWRAPVNNAYWVHNGNTYANATKEDLFMCIKSAEKAFETWRTTSLFFRVKILKDLASTLECNGKILLSNTVSNVIIDWIKLSNSKHLLKYEDEKLEITNIYRPKGVVSIYHEDDYILINNLTYALIIGNCVVVICNKNSSTLAPYFNMFSTAGVPSGVINLFSSKNAFDSIPTDGTHHIKEIVEFCTYINQIILPIK